MYALAVASIAGLAGVATLAVAPAGGAPLTATQVRIAEHPGLVRAVVDFSGGRVQSGEVVATDPAPFRDGEVRLPLFRPGVTTTAAPVSAHGVSVSIRQGAGRIAIRLSGAERRFKYVRYRALHDPERLAIDLYESTPPAPAAEVWRAPGGCLALRRFSVGPRRVSAAGRERHLFEHGFVLRLRRAGGRVHAQRAGTAARGRWSTTFRYPRARRQIGTLEAVALSAKDGTAECLVQVRVRFGGG